MASLTRRCPRRAPAALALLPIAALLMFAGCGRSPLAMQRERDLRESIIRSLRREVAEAEQHQEVRVTEREFRPDLLGIDPKLLQQLREMAGPESYAGDPLPLDRDLLGRDATTTSLSLERAIKSASSNNLELQFQRLAPAINEAQVVAAEAAFDWVLFGEANTASLDEVTEGNSFSPGSVSTAQRRTANADLGIRRNLITGGQFTIQTGLDHEDFRRGGSGSIDPNNNANLALQYNQPLLRGFGSDVSQARIRLAINAERDEIAQLKAQMIATVTETEQAYWDLVRARWDLLIFQRLLERGIDTRDKTKAREVLDAGPAQISNAIATVEARRGFLITSQEAYRRASDQLKRLINDPDMPVGSEMVLIPIDQPLDAPIRYNLLDSYITAIDNRPEVQQAILSIDNTSIRQVVADNQRLPQLDLRLQMRFNGLDDDFDQSWDQIIDGQFVSYLAGLVFEQPIGNRLGEAQSRQARLERAQSIISYQNTIQNVINEVKTELRQVVTEYKLVEQARITRVAAAESLRSFQVEMELQLGFTVQNLEIWFNRQTELAQAERDEINELVRYNIALARLQAAMGTALERNKIEFIVPDAPFAPR